MFKNVLFLALINLLWGCPQESLPPDVPKPPQDSNGSAVIDAGVAVIDAGSVIIDAGSDSDCDSCPAGMVLDTADCACADIDECLFDNGDCDENADCENADISGQLPLCVCQSGFFGDGLNCNQWAICSSLEYESMAPTNASDRVCAELTICDASEIESVVPTATSDRACVDRDECAEGIDACGANTICENRVGGYDCPCVDGFELIADDGCVPIDLCRDVICANGTCEPDTGLCLCELGWAGIQCDTEGEIIALDVLDTEGESVMGTAVKIDGRWVEMPGAVTVIAGEPLKATHVDVCNGARLLTGSAIIPQVDTSWVYDIGDHSQSSTGTADETAVHFVLAQPFKPVAWFPFEDPTTSGTLRSDIVDGWMSQNAIDVSQQVPGIVGNAIDWAPDNNLTLQYYARINSSTGEVFGKDASWAQRDWLVSDSFTIEILFENSKGFILGTTPRFFELVNRLKLVLRVGSITLYAGGETASFLLDGTGPASIDYYQEGWHHFAVTYDSPTGALRLWVDGFNPESFVYFFEPGTVFARGNHLEIGGGVFWRTPLLFDELAFFNGVLPPELIYAHAQDALQEGRSYATCLRSLEVPEGPNTIKPDPGGREPRYYAPGFPSYAVVDGHPRAQSQLSQLESFPLPRYQPGHTLMPQMSWMGDAYLAGKAQAGQPVGSALNEATAVIHAELAQNWHYHYSVPGATYPSASHPMVGYANAHPEWKTFVIGLWPQVRPVNHAEVFDTADWDHMDASGITPGARAFISTDYPTLSLEHFPNDGVSPISTSYKSPAAPMHTWRLDGKVQAKGFKTMLEALAPRKAAGALPIDHYNENGEVVSTYNLSASIASDPAIMTMMQDWDPASVDDTTTPPTLVSYPDPLNYKLFLGYAVNEMRSAYLAPLKEEPDAQDTIFTWYAVDGNRQYRPLYEEARYIQTPVDGMYRATPDFYPRKPAWWLNGAGAWHGYNWLGKARLHEIEQGDKLFWPFLAAGWANSPITNIGAGQWLGLLKIVAAMGADSWYTGHFSLGPPPNFPQAEGWVWQAVAPSYAQAVTSRYEDILRDGDLIQPRTGWIPQAGYHKDYFSLYTGKPNREIVVARRLGDEWVFAGALPPSTYDVGQLPMHSVAWVRYDFDDDGELDEIKIPIRRQGSVYRWDRRSQPPTLIQLDTWHEPWHPWYWDRGFHFEAEVHDGLTANTGHNWSVFTDAPFAPDYTNFTTLLQILPSDETTWTDFDDAPGAHYEFAPRTLTDLYVWVRARMKDDTAGSLKVTMNEESEGPQDGVFDVVGEEWQWLSINVDTDTPLVFSDVAPAQHMEPEDGSAHFDLRHKVTLRPSSAQIEVDRFILSDDINFKPEHLIQPQDVLEVGTHLPQNLQEGLLWHLNSESEVAVDGDERVVSWGDVRDPTRMLSSTDGPIRTLDEDGKVTLSFQSEQSLVGILGADLTEATIMMRVRLSDLQLDTAYLYALGHDGVVGGAMTLAHSASPWENAESSSLHWDGVNAYAGEPIYADRFVTLTEVFFASPRADGSYSQLFIDGVDANMPGASVPYVLDAGDVFVVGDALDLTETGFNGELVEILVYDRALPTWAHQAVSSYLWNRMR